MKRWIAMGIETRRLAWTASEVTVKFKGREVLLRPETDELMPSIAFAYEPPTDWDDAIKFGHEFLSSVTWATGHAVNVSFIVGGSRPGGIGKPNLARGVDRQFRLDYLPEVASEKARLALALYREALNVNSVPYRFLGYFKIINIIHNKGAEQKTWIDLTLPKIKQWEARKCIAEPRPVPVTGDYLYVSGRCAVAHAYGHPVVNPDDTEASRRLVADMPIMKALAEHAIEHELGVHSFTTILDEHLFELKGFRELLRDDMVAQLKSGATIDVGDLKIPHLSIRLRNNPKFAAFERLRADVLSTDDGIVVLHCVDFDGTVEARIRLNFPTERLEFDPRFHLRVQASSSSRGLQNRIDARIFVKTWLGNGEIEIWDGDAEQLLGCHRPFIPNFDPQPSCDELDFEIAELLERLSIVSAASASDDG